MLALIRTVYFRDFCCDGLRRRTPGPPPFSSMNSTPALSKARLMTSRVARRGSTRPGFQLMHSHDSNARFVCEVLLVPSKQSAGCPGLLRCNHASKDEAMRDSYNSI